MLSWGMGCPLPRALARTVEALEPLACRPAGGRPVRKRRLPTSWVRVSMDMPRTTVSLSACSTNPPTQGPKTMPGTLDDTSSP